MLTETKLTKFHPEKTSLPKHIGIIPDGSGRWAISHEVSDFEAYSHAMDKLREILNYLYAKGVLSISVYLSSIQNLRRSPENVEAFCKAEASLCDNILPDITKTHGVKTVIAGNVAALPEYLSTSLRTIAAMTHSHKSKKLYLCAAYNPLEEIIEAFRQSPSPEEFIDYLWVNEPLDLVIRTTDANLFSNFLPLQSGYARLYIVDKLFNDISIEDIKKILDEFAELNRRFGD